jgi:hypothetical protein
LINNTTFSKQFTGALVPKSRPERSTKIIDSVTYNLVHFPRMNEWMRRDFTLRTYFICNCSPLMR